MGRNVRRSGQAVVEFVIVVPVVLLLAFGGVGVGRIVHVRMTASAVAREAARAGVLSPMPPVGSQQGALDAAVLRAAQVASDYHVSCQPAIVQVFAPPGSARTYGPGSRIQVDVDCAVGAGTLPFLRWRPDLSVHAMDLEQVDPFRSLTHPPTPPPS